MVLASSVAPVVIVVLWFADHRAWAASVLLAGFFLGLGVTRWCDSTMMRRVTPEQSRRSRFITYTALACFVGILVYALAHH
jgi:cytochrome c biogenesis protein CcdA